MTTYFPLKHDNFLHSHVEKKDNKQVTVISYTMICHAAIAHTNEIS